MKDEQKNDYLSLVIEKSVQFEVADGDTSERPGNPKYCNPNGKDEDTIEK